MSAADPRKSATIRGDQAAALWANIGHFHLDTIKVKVNDAWICIAPCRDHTSKVLRYGTRSQGISQFYLHTPHSSANRINHTCLYRLFESYFYHAATDELTSPNGSTFNGTVLMYYCIGMWT